MTDPQTTEKKFRFDGNDVLFYAGLVLLGIGLAFAVSWPVALATVGASLAAVGLVNSYVSFWKGS